MQRYRPELAFLILVLLGLASGASAQSNAQQLADVNKQAMEAFTNLEVDQARTSLEKAARQAEKAGVRGPALARTYSNLGVVLIAGSGDQAGGVAAFERALQEDPTVEPDPLVATPEVMVAFNAAKQRAPKPAEAPPAPRGPRRPSGPPTFEGNLDHTPPAEQLTQTALPIFVRSSDELDIDRIKVSYRSIGMQKPKTADMQETDDGYTFLIPCSDVFEPVVEYFLVAVDRRGRGVGNAGSAANPIAVPIVRERTQPAPALPGQMPPTQCAADNECPPGMPGCRSGNAGMGDTCSRDNDCQSGLICEDDFCVVGERGEDEEEDSDGGKRFFLDVSFGVGLTSVRSGRAPDRTPQPYINSIADATVRPDGTYDTDAAEALLRRRGFECQAVDNMAMRKLQLADCTVAVDPGGLVPVPLIYVAAGYYLTQRFAMAITGRFQLARGEGPLAGMVLGLRAEYLLTQPKETGVRAGLLLGFGVGQMQARPPPAKGADASGPFATNAGLPGNIGAAASLGTKLAYRFIPNLGVHLTPALSLGFPSALFAVDVMGGAELAF